MFNTNIVVTIDIRIISTQKERVGKIASMSTTFEKYY